jgi:curved DNA binding protein
MSDESETEEVADLSSPEVTTKYRTAGDIATRALAKVVEACVDGADVLTICELGDNTMMEETGKLYNKKVKDKKIEKGIAFPTCISVNEIVAHYSPMKGESSTLKNGDLVKIDMACHIDGFIASAAHTIVLGEERVEDRRADVAQAAWAGVEAALRLVQVGNTSNMVTEAFGKIAADFDCKPVAGIKSHQLKKHVIDGTKAIPSVESLEEKSEPFEFELNEVYCIDVMMSTGEGKCREAEMRSTVFKRNVENNYLLKTQKARQFISEVNKRFPALPFSLRAIEDEHVARIGASEAKRHELLEEYCVLKAKDKELVAQYKMTVLLLPGGTKRITGLPFPEAQFVSKLEVKDEGLKKLLSSSTNPKKKKNKSKKEPKSEEKQEEKKEEAKAEA